MSPLARGHIERMLNSCRKLCVFCFRKLDNLFSRSDAQSHQALAVESQTPVFSRMHELARPSNEPVTSRTFFH